MLELIKEWRVDVEAESHSDHRYIKFSVIEQNSRREEELGQVDGWETSKMNGDRLLSVMKGHQVAEDACREYSGKLREACHVSIPARKGGARKSVFWWCR